MLQRWAAQLLRGQLGPPGHTPEPLAPKIFPSRGGLDHLPQAQHRRRPPRSGGPSARSKTIKNTEKPKSRLLALRIAHFFHFLH